MAVLMMTSVTGKAMKNNSAIKIAYSLAGKEYTLCLPLLYGAMPRRLEQLKTLVCALVTKKESGKKLSENELMSVGSLPKTLQGLFLRRKLISEEILNKANEVYEKEQQLQIQYSPFRQFLEVLGRKIDAGQTMTRDDLRHFISLASEDNKEMLLEALQGVLRDSLCRSL